MIVMTRLFIFDAPYIRRSGKGIDYWGIGLHALGNAGGTRADRPRTGGPSYEACHEKLIKRA
jgi:hypothetical protein